MKETDKHCFKVTHEWWSQTKIFHLDKLRFDPSHYLNTEWVWKDKRKDKYSIIKIKVDVLQNLENDFVCSMGLYKHVLLLLRKRLDLGT